MLQGNSFFFVLFFGYFLFFILFFFLRLSTINNPGVGRHEEEIDEKEGRRPTICMTFKIESLRPLTSGFSGLVTPKH